MRLKSKDVRIGKVGFMQYVSRVHIICVKIVTNCYGALSC